MCGIFGFVSSRPLDPAVIVEGLRFLEYRGYDSWGIAVASGGQIASEKAIGPMAGADPHLPAGNSAIGHTRWATHGGVTQANAHPHLGCGNRYALIHNGIVENHQELRYRLQGNHVFSSQTDTEVLVHLLEEEMDQDGDLLQSLLRIFRQVEGLSAVAVLDAQGNQIAAAKNGSPLSLGVTDGVVYLASDPNALVDVTREIVFMEDGQAATLDVTGLSMVQVDSGKPLSPDIHHVSWDGRRSDLGGFAHFMEKEVAEQPRILRETAEHRHEDALRLAECISGARDVFLIGCGTAYHAALTGRYMLADMAATSAQAVIASEMSTVAPLLRPGSLVIALSQSGETIDVLEAVKEARRRGATVVALVNAEGSALDRSADLSVLLECGPERCVLATKSFTAKLAVLHLTSRALQGKIERGRAEIRDASERVADLLAREAAEGTIRDTARRIFDQQHVFILGRNNHYPSALEAALKIKEVTYMHAEGFASGELKHGVIALVTYGTPCIVLAPDGRFRREALTAAAEVRARGAFTIGLSPTPEEEFDITLPVCGGEAAPFEIAAVTQRLAYELALLRGCDPDRPRNLAKSVTVK